MPGDDGLRWSGCGYGGLGQSGGDAIPPGEEPGHRSAHSRQFPRLVAMSAIDDDTAFQSAALPADLEPRAIGREPTAKLSVERISSFNEEDLLALCEATDAAIIDGGGFGWITPPGRQVLESYFRGL